MDNMEATQQLINYQCNRWCGARVFHIWGSWSLSWEVVDGLENQMTSCSNLKPFAWQENIWGDGIKSIYPCVFVSVCLQRGQRPADPEEVTNEALRTMCDNTLHLLTTTVGRLADVRSLSIRRCCCRCLFHCSRVFMLLVSLQQFSCG